MSSNDRDKNHENTDGLDRDLLISRVIDGEASPEDWTAFRAIAATDQSIWRDLAESQQDQAELTAALDAELSIADSVAAPTGAHFEHHMNERFRRVGSWAGWAAAAAVVLMWTLGPFQVTSGGDIAGVPRPQIDTPKQALDLYLNKGVEQGTVIAEMPAKVMLDARPNPDGPGYVVLYYRQILEQAVLPDMMGLDGTDDEGKPVVKPKDLGVGRSL